MNQAGPNLRRPVRSILLDAPGRPLLNGGAVSAPLDRELSTGKGGKMNLLDFGVIIILGVCLVRGIFRGLVKELSSLIGALGGLYAAYAYYPRIAQPLSRWIADPAYANIAACLLLFSGVFIVVGILGVIIKYLMNISFLGWTDRISGAFFGAVKGILLVSVLILVLTTFLPKNAAIVRNSVSAHSFMRISATLALAASKDMRTLFSYKMKELSKSWQEKKS